MKKAAPCEGAAGGGEEVTNAEYKTIVMLSGKYARSKQAHKSVYMVIFCNSAVVGISIRLKANHFLPKSLMLAPR